MGGGADDQEVDPAGISSAGVAQQPGAVDAAVGDAAGPDQHPVGGPAAEVAPPPHRAVVFPLRAAQLQTQPEARRKFCRAEVTDGRHLVGAAEQDLHAHVEADPAVAGRRRAVTGETAASAEGGPALALRAGATPFIWRQIKKQEQESS